MRIRSVKPEFWRSGDIADLDYFTRLLFIGLWNYVDDNGVGEDNLNLIRSDLFPREDIATIEPLIIQALTELSLRAQITRYRDRKTGRRYFKVINWHHQKINRPTASRKPLPTSEDVELIEDSLIAQGRLIEDSLADQGIKGSRERGNQGPPYPPAPRSSRRPTGAELARTRFANIPSPPSPHAQQIAQAFSEAIGMPLDAKSADAIIREIDGLLAAGQHPDNIAAGMHLWSKSDSWAPSQIPHFVTKAAAQTAAAPPPDAKVNDWLATAHTPTTTQKALHQ